MNAFEEAAADRAARRARAELSEATKLTVPNLLAYLTGAPRCALDVAHHFGETSEKAAAMLCYVAQVGKARRERVWSQERERHITQYTAHEGASVRPRKLKFNNKDR